MADLTLVSGFIDISKYDPVKRNYGATDAIRTFSNFYAPHVRTFLELKTPKIVFLEQEVIEQIRDSIDTSHTLVVPFEKEDLYLWPRREQLLTLEIPQTDNPYKDSLDYFIIQHQKVYWADRASKLNMFQTSKFMWIDCGFNYVLQKTKSISTLEDLIHGINTDHIDAHTIRIPGCWKFPSADKLKTELDSNSIQITWYFCGGVFAGSADAISRFTRLQNRVIERYIQRGVFTFELNTWFHILGLASDLFDWYYAGHCHEMLSNF